MTPRPVWIEFADLKGNQNMIRLTSINSVRDADGFDNVPDRSIVNWGSYGEATCVTRETGADMRKLLRENYA